MLSDAGSSVTSRSINNGALSCAAARLCEVHAGLSQTGNWQPAILRCFCRIRTGFCDAVVMVAACSASSERELKASHTAATCLSVCER